MNSVLFSILFVAIESIQLLKYKRLAERVEISMFEICGSFFFHLLNSNDLCEIGKMMMKTCSVLFAGTCVLNSMCSIDSWLASLVCAGAYAKSVFHYHFSALYNWSLCALSGMYTILSCANSTHWIPNEWICFPCRLQKKNKKITNKKKN